MLKKSATYILSVSFLAVLLTSCGSSKTTRVTAGYYDGNTTTSSRHTSRPKGAPQSEALLSEARSWLGVPYKYGGNDRSGVDCSGFVLQVYQNALDIPLPRTSREQNKYCKATTKGSLIPGDLIFFASDKDKETISHVGIFMGDNMMIHASSSKGVVISDITSSYYTRNYAGSGIVERYHAMIGDKSSKKKGKKDKTPTSQEGPVIHMSPLESPAGFTLTPVDGLPVPADRQKDSPKPKTSPETAPKSTNKPVRTATATATTSSAAAKEPTVEDARNSVLNSIKEKEL
ncbi:MAG: C40 family peptidase [Bacteroides sp.]|nr:C40 family peptidase [Bacteroides sp.]